MTPQPADAPNPTSEALAALVGQAAASGGFAFGPVAAEARPPWVDELISQFNRATDRTLCPHLRAGDKAAFWLALAPDLLACPECSGELVARLEARLGHTLAEEPARCSVCDQFGPARGVSVASGRFLLRGLLCANCEEVDISSQSSEPAAPEPPPTARSLEALGLN